jgi:H3 lysine-79-specific histone-lysine N-methyltransferase
MAMNLLSRNSRDKELLDGFKTAVDNYNKALETLLNDGNLSKNIDSMHHLPFEMVRLILRQVYDRAVSPQVDILKRTKDNKDNTYGELLAQFVTMVVEETQLKSDQVFVDLGSGVGNVVLQTALEVGCESWGCEMMPNACDLADAQEKEFVARCRLWGIKPGKVHLQRDDFTRNVAIHEAIKRADVILVNNEVFSEELNGNLVQLFLDVKDKCKIVSLKPLSSSDSKIKSRNFNDPSNLFEVVQKQYFEDFVSWKHEGGDYYISTKDDKRLQKFSHLG